MLYFKLATILACAILFWWGGYSFKMARRAIMAVLLGAMCAYITWTWWVFFAVGAGCQFMGLGYGEDSPLYKFLGPWIARGVWATLVAAGIAVGLVLGGFLPLWLAGVYVAYNGLVAALLVKKNGHIMVVDPCIGVCLGSIVLYL